MWTKICGNTNLEDARLAIEFGADALGFIFAPSKRQVTPARAKEILQDLPDYVETVGVFTTGDVSSISNVVRETGLTAVQLHMPLQTELLRHLCAELGESVRMLQVVGFEAVPAHPREELRRFRSALDEALGRPELFAVLIDARQGSASGGLGVPINWRLAAETVREAGISAQSILNAIPPRVVLAGGLHAENVREAVDTIKPWGVDAVSGVEASPGTKDPVKLRAFLEETRALQVRDN